MVDCSAGSKFYVLEISQHAMPFCFQVVTRAVLWELNKGTRHKLRGESLMYVDDIIAASLACDVEHDQAIVTALVDGLLGDGAMAQKKTVVETEGVLEAIGYRIDRINERVGISEGNTHKAFYAAWDVGDGTNVTVKMMEKVAAHAARYKRVCPFMAAFTSVGIVRIDTRTHQQEATLRTGTTGNGGGANDAHLADPHGSRRDVVHQVVPIVLATGAASYMDIGIRCKSQGNRDHMVPPGRQRRSGGGVLRGQHRVAGAEQHGGQVKVYEYGRVPSGNPGGTRTDRARGDEPTGDGEG
jgi:hypothetical protein